MTTWLVTCLALVGCATFGKRAPVPEAVATGRELSRQGASAMQLGQWEEAETLLRKSLEASPADAVTRRHLAETLWQRGDPKEAMVQMEAAVRMDPSDVSSIVRSGEMLLAMESTEEAFERANEAIGLDPEFAPAWALRGRVYWHRNELDRALADLQRALQFAPSSNDVLVDVATLYRQRGQHQRCLTTVHHLLDSYASGEEPQFALFLEGLALADLGRTRDAVDSLQAASERGEPKAEILYHLARCQWQLGQIEQAVASARRALAADASHQPSQQLLAQLAQRTSPAAGSVVR